MGMNYPKIYESLITKATSRTIVGYTEKHHIIPKCMGGTNSSDNLVKLTPEEHYLAHQLLVKIHPSHSGLIYAAKMMCVNRTTNKMYGWLKRKYSVAKSKEQTGSGNSQFGKIWITNSSHNNRKLDIAQPIPLGWVRGVTYPPIFKPIKQCRACNQKQRAAYWFNEYSKSNCNSLRDFAKVSSYPYSHVSLCKLFKLIPEFTPIHGQSYILS